MSNFSQAYAVPPNLQFNGYTPKAMFSNNDFINPNDILHNNLHKNLLNKKLTKSTIVDKLSKNTNDTSESYIEVL